MFYQPEILIYLWMLPVLAMVVLPALWAMSCMLYRVVERSRLADVQGYIDLNRMESTGFEGGEKRKHSRIRVDGPKVKVARQVNCCQTHVANVSLHGICFTSIPRKMYYDADEQLNVVFRTRERDYEMSVLPRWRKKGGSGYLLGAEIISASAGWKSFVEGLCQPMAAEAA